MKTLRWLINCFVLIISMQSNVQAKQNILAVQGTIDLSEWNFETDGPLMLNGEWDFYWNALIKPGTFDQTTNKPVIYNFPNYWNGTIYNGETVVGEGYGTYRLIVKTKATGEYMMLGIKQTMTAYKLWLNGKLVAENGNISTSPTDFAPDYLPRFVAFRLDTTHYELVMQVANYSHRLGGVYDGIEIGTTEQIVNQRIVYTGLDMFLFGVLIIMALYHFGLYALRRKDISPLMFGFYALIMALRIFFTREDFVEYLIPSLSWETNYKFEYFTVYLTAPAMIGFLYTVFREVMHKWVVRVVYIVAAIFVLPVIFTSALFYSHMMMPYYVFILALLVYIVYVLVQAIRKKLSGAVALMFGCMVFSATVINDMLHSQSMIHTFEMYAFGLCVMIGSQSYLLAMRFSRSFSRNEDLTEQLNYQNKNLEKIVTIRTSEIEQQKEEIIAQRDALEEQNHHIEAQNESIRSSIRYAQTIQQAILPIKPHVDEHFDNFVIYYPKDIVSGDFYWFLQPTTQYLFVAVVDCTGHGVPGAFMSMIGSRLLNQIVVEQNIYEPSAILTLLDAEVRKALKQDQTQNNDGMDMSMCRMEKIDSGWNIAFSGAKNDLWHYNAKEKNISFVPADRRSVGGVGIKQREHPFEQKHVTLANGDMIYLMSDGLIDQPGADRKRFGSQRLKELLQRIGSKPTAEQEQTIEQELINYQTSQPQRDDITIWGIRC